MKKKRISKFGVYMISVTLLIIAALLVPHVVNARAKIDITDYEGNIYADCGLIMKKPSKKGRVVITMQNGNQFAFTDKDEDWMVGDLVAVVFDDNGTEKVYDDIILSTRYCGWISKKEMKRWIKS